MTDAINGRAVGPITDEREFWRAVVGLVYRVVQFADFGAYDAQRPAALEDVLRLWAFLDALGEELAEAIEEADG